MVRPVSDVHDGGGRDGSSWRASCGLPVTEREWSCEGSSVLATLMVFAGCATHQVPHSNRQGTWITREVFVAAGARTEDWDSGDGADAGSGSAAGDDWAVVSASLDDSGTGGDVAAGMRAAALTPDPAAIRDPPPPALRRPSSARRRATAVAVVSSLRVEPSGEAPCCSSGGGGGTAAGGAQGSRGAQAEPALGEADAWELEHAGDAGSGDGGAPAGGAARWGMRAVGSTAARAGSVMRGAQRMGVLGARVRPTGLCTGCSYRVRLIRGLLFCTAVMSVSGVLRRGRHWHLP